VRTAFAAALLLLCGCADTVVDLDAQFTCAGDSDCRVDNLERWHCIDQICRPDGYDAGVPDAGAMDAGTPDAGTPDAGVPDAGMHDAGTPDAGTPDAGMGTGDSGSPTPTDAGESDAGDGG
jgi:hypothetical protein